MLKIERQKKQEIHLRQTFKFVDENKKWNENEKIH